MSFNSFGNIFRITTFGESHGAAIGVVIDGCPAGYEISLSEIQNDLNRRKPGQSKITTSRREDDEFQVLSGIYDGKTLGTPIALMISNQDARSKDYNYLAEHYRPSHADYTYSQKYGLRDHRGGGRSSARETVARVAAGSIAKQILATEGISCWAYVQQVGNIICNIPYQELNRNQIESNIVRCPDARTAELMLQAIEQVKKDGDSLGGIISAVIQGLPIGLGEPIYDKFQAVLAHAMLSINACHGFDYGSGFAGAGMKGSENNDAIFQEDGIIKTKTNHAGGILGGISNGEDIYFRVAFKPVASISKIQESINIQGESRMLQNEGRHDPCVLPRAVPIVEAMSALVCLDFLLLQKTRKKPA